jgi:hypothetical protein
MKVPTQPDTDRNAAREPGRGARTCGAWRLPTSADVKMELYGNWVRIEPGEFGAHAELINTLGGFLAEAVPDDQDLVVGPQAGSLDHAREQFRRACAEPVPDGFIRIVQELTGFEEEGAIGAIYLVLKDRWDLDRPF